MSNEKNDNVLKNIVPEELGDDKLDAVAGGTGTDTVVTLKYRVGDVVIVNRKQIDYCPRCARLLINYEATITGIRGILDGTPLYWVTRNCCGYESSESENFIVRRA